MRTLRSNPQFSVPTVYLQPTYMLQVRVTSYASRNQLAVTQKEIDQGTELEWDRRLITVLGAANNRLYEFRLQTANSTYEANKDTLLTIAHSFTCKEVEA